MNEIADKAAVKTDLPAGNGIEKPEVPETPPRLILDLRAACNLKCRLCPLHGVHGEDFKDELMGEMTLDRARAILDEVMIAKPLIQPQLYGEPLLVHNLKEHISAMKSRGMAVALNSNGLTLTDDIAEFFVDNALDAIFFSVDAVTPETLKRVRRIDKLDKVEGAVHRMLRVRGDKPHPRIDVSLTVQDANKHEVDTFVAKWTPVADCRK